MNINREPCSICEYYMNFIVCDNHECPVAIMKAENKRLQEQFDSNVTIAREREEAIKEFAEKLKKKHYFYKADGIGDCYKMSGNDIDNLVKKMTDEVQNA